MKTRQTHIDEEKIFTEDIIEPDFKNNRVKLFGVIYSGADKCVEYLKKFEAMRVPALDILIHCKGGDGFEVYKIGKVIYEIREKIKIRGINIGMAYSAGFSLLQYCPFRASLPKGKFRIHEGIFVDPNDRSKQVKPDEDCKKLIRFDLELLSYKTGKPESVIRKWEKEEKFWTAQEALKDNLIDEILYDYKI